MFLAPLAGAASGWKNCLFPAVNNSGCTKSNLCYFAPLENDITTFWPENPPVVGVLARRRVPVARRRNRDPTQSQIPVKCQRHQRPHARPERRKNCLCGRAHARDAPFPETPAGRRVLPEIL